MTEVFSISCLCSWGTGCSCSLTSWDFSWDEGWMCWFSLSLSSLGLTWTRTGLTLATMVLERGLMERPRCTVSQPSASFFAKDWWIPRYIYIYIYIYTEILVHGFESKWLSKEKICSPGFSAGMLTLGLGTGRDWEYLTRSAQLGPVWERRAAAKVGGGPL